MSISSITSFVYKLNPDIYTITGILISLIGILSVSLKFSVPYRTDIFTESGYMVWKTCIRQINQ